MTMPPHPDQNLATVQQAIGAVLATGDTAALASVLANDFVHHRPDLTRTKDEWLDAVRRAVVPLSGMEVTIDHALATGDHVVMHSRRRLPSGAAVTVVDIWRFEEGKVAEAWEVIEPDADAGNHFEWWTPGSRGSENSVAARPTSAGA